MLKSSGAERYGKYFWGVEDDKGGVHMIFADRIEIQSSGALVFWGHDLERESEKDGGAPDGIMWPYISWAAGCWRNCWAAKLLDGEPLSVDSRDESDRH